MDYKFKTEPYEHQLQALGASHNKENFALLMEMGTGKSKVLVDNIAMLYDKGKIDGALIIAPKGVYRNWEKQEIPIHLPDHVKHQMIIWSPNKTKKQEKELNKLFKHEEELMIFIMIIDLILFCSHSYISFCVNFFRQIKTIFFQNSERKLI